MGCVRSKLKSSHCQRCGTRRYPSLAHIPKPQFTQETFNSRDIFSLAHTMSYIEDDLDVSEERTPPKRPRTDPNPSNIFVAEHKVSRKQRGQALDKRGDFRGCVVWFTGLSGAGKSTVAMGVEKKLVSRGLLCYCLDGDNMRAGLNKGLGFSMADRKENIRRTAEAAVLMADAGNIVLCSLVSPTREDRENARKIADHHGFQFFEVFVNTPLEECERRDTKGLYRKCRAGEIKGFTGIDQAYEEPRRPELVLKTVNQTIEQTVDKVIRLLKDHEVIPEILPASVLNGSTGCPRVEELFVASEIKAKKQKEAETLYSLEITEVELQWVQVLAEGWASPLKGFMREDEYLQCLHFNCLKINGKIVNQSLPIVLSLSDVQKNELQGHQAIALQHQGRLIAILSQIELFPHRKEERISRQFGTHHPDHPSIHMINKMGDWLIGGDLEVFEKIKWNDGLDALRLTPKELNRKFEDLKADVVYAFQLRNPVHNGHALLMKDCEKQLKEQGYQRPVLLLHPLGGWTKEDDVPLDVRIRQHQAILDEGVLDPKSTVLAIFPSPMMYAGPTEVQWHAKARLNAGANYYIVGRDPAGMPHPDRSKGDLYDATHGGRVLAMAPGLDKLNILKFKVAAYDTKENKMAYFDPARSADFEFISGTKMRGLARQGQTPPAGFMAPKAWKVLATHYQGQQNGRI